MACLSVDQISSRKLKSMPNPDVAENSNPIAKVVDNLLFPEILTLLEL